MTDCARAGCRRLVPFKKTKPSNYCSTRCRVADFRRRKRIRALLTDIGFDDVVTQLRCVIKAQQQGQGEERDAALTTLATHPLVAGSRATAETNSTFSSSQRSARSRIGVQVAPSGEEDRGS